MTTCPHGGLLGACMTCVQEMELVRDPLLTKQDHAWALREIDKIFDAEFGTPEGDRLELLIAAVDAYETKHHVIPPPEPQSTG